VNILTFSSLYPNEVQPTHGLFVETRLRKLVERHPVAATVMAPVPWFPFSSPRFGRYAEFRRVPERAVRGGIEVLYPRYFVLPKLGMNVGPQLMAAGVAAAARRLQQDVGRIDLIDAHYFYPDGVAAALLSQRLDIPVVITARGSDINLIARYRRPRRQILWAARQAAHVITVSRNLRDAVIEMGIPAESVTTLRNGVDLDVFRLPEDRGALRRRLGFHRRTLVSVGNLLELKGHDLVIRALAELPHTDLVIIGKGPQLADLKALAARLGLADRVRVMGPLAQTELRHYYAAADALVLASSREGWPNVLLESMACGTPVIGAPVGGVPEITGSDQAGLLMADRTPGAITAAIAALFAALPERNRTRQYAAGFAWDTTSDGQWEIFSAAVNGKS